MGMAEGELAAGGMLEEAGCWDPVARRWYQDLDAQSGIMRQQSSREDPAEIAPRE